MTEEKKKRGPGRPPGKKSPTGFTDATRAEFIMKRAVNHVRSREIAKEWNDLPEVKSTPGAEIVPRTVRHIVGKWTKKAAESAAVDADSLYQQAIVGLADQAFRESHLLDYIERDGGKWRWKDPGQWDREDLRAVGLRVREIRGGELRLEITQDPHQPIRAMKSLIDSLPAIAASQATDLVAALQRAGDLEGMRRIGEGENPLGALVSCYGRVTEENRALERRVEDLTEALRELKDKSATRAGGAD